MPTSKVLDGFQPANVLDGLTFDSSLAKDIEEYNRTTNSTAIQAFMEGATTLGANISGALGTLSEDNIFKDTAKALLEARKDNHYHSSYDQNKAKEQLYSGDVLGAMETIGFSGTVEEFFKSAPYMLMYALDPTRVGIASMALSGTSYAFENAQKQKELNHDTSPIKASDVFNLHNISNAASQAALDRFGFKAEAKAFNIARNIKARQLLKPSGVLSLAKEAGRGFIGEGVTEAMQTALQESYARNDYLSVVNNEDAQKEALFAGLVGSMVGGNASTVGSVVPSFGKSVTDSVGNAINEKRINKNAKQAYEKLSEEDKKEVSQDEFEKKYKENAKADLERSGSSVSIDEENNKVVITSKINEQPVFYDPVEDTVRVVAEDGSVANVEDLTKKDKDTIKRNAVYETIKDMSNEEIESQKEMWKLLGFDAENDIATRDILGSKKIENEAREELENIINSVKTDNKNKKGFDTAKVINSKLMAEIAAADELSLEAKLKRKTLFGQTPEERLKSIIGKWENNNISEKARKQLLDFMTAEKRFAESRMNYFRSVKGGEKIKVTPSTSKLQPNQKQNSQNIKAKVQENTKQTIQKNTKQAKVNKKPKKQNDGKPQYLDKIVDKNGNERLIATDKNGTVFISKNKELWGKKYEEQVWKKKKEYKDGSESTPIDIDMTFNEFKQFIYARELALGKMKKRKEKKEDETIEIEKDGEYEDRINERALEWIGKIKYEIEEEVFNSKIKKDIWSEKKAKRAYERQESKTPNKEDIEDIEDVEDIEESSIDETESDEIKEDRTDFHFSDIKNDEDMINHMVFASKVTRERFNKRAGLIGTEEQIDKQAKDMVARFRELFTSVANVVNYSVGFEKIRAGKINTEEAIEIDPMSILAKEFVVSDGKIAYAKFGTEFTDVLALIALDSTIASSSFNPSKSNMEFYENFFGDNVSELNRAIAFGGTSKHLIAPQIGRRVLSTLGYKIDGSAKKEWKDRLEAQIGFVAISAMVKNGYAQEESFYGHSDEIEDEIENEVEDSVENQKKEDDKNKSKPVMTFIKPTDKTRQMAVHLKPLANYLNKDIGQIPFIDDGSLEIPIIETIRHTNMKISKNMKKSLKILQSKRYKLNREMFDIIYDYVTTDDELDISKVDKFLGLQTDEEIENIHILYRDNAIQKRNQARLQFQRSFDFFSSLDNEDKFGYQYYIASNNRAMTDCSFGGDYQQDKHFSRFVIDYIGKDGTTEYEVNEETSGEFVFAVLQALEPLAEEKGWIKKGVDKSTQSMNNKAFKELVKFVRNTKNKKELIELAIKYNGVHGLRGMKELIKHEKNFNLNTSKVKKGTTFKTDLIFEADGITNGLSHQIVQTTIGSKFTRETESKVKSVFRRVGLLNEKNKTVQAFRNGSESRLDTYEETASQANLLAKNPPKGKENAIEVFKIIKSPNDHKNMNEPFKRSDAKSPTMVFQYGASIKAIARNFAEKIIEELITKIVNGEIDDQTIEKIVNLSEKISKKTNKPYFQLKFLKKFIGKKDKRNIRITAREYNMAVIFFTDVGDLFGEVLDGQFPTIKQFQNSVYEANSHIRKLVTSSEKYKKLIEKLNSSDITIDEYKEARKELEAMMPKFRSGWDTPLSPSKTIESHELEEYNPKGSENERTRVRYYVDGKRTSNSFLVKHKRFNESSFFWDDEKYNAHQTGDKTAGVTLTHSTDSGVMNDEEVVELFAQQIFDAIIAGVGQMNKVSETYNKVFIYKNALYSSYSSIMDGLGEVIDNAEKWGVDLQDIINAKRFLSEKYSDAAESIQNMKNNIDWINSVGQMSGFDGGVYNLTKEDKENLYSKLNGLKLAFTVKADKYKNSELKDSNNDETPNFKAKEKVKKTKKKKYETGTLFNTNSSMPKHKVISETDIEFNEKEILETFRKLGEYDKPSNSSYLETFVMSIVDKLGNPAGKLLSNLKISINNVETVGEFNKATGSIHVSVSEKIKNYQYMTAQETFAHELVHKASEYALFKAKGLNAQLKELMEKTKAKLDDLGGYEYFMEIMPNGRINAIISEEEEIKAAKEKYEYIFSHPSEFLAYGLTNEKLMNALSDMKDVKSNSIFDRLVEFFDYIISFISSKLNNTVRTSGTYDNQLKDLSVAIFALNKQYNNDSFFSIGTKGFENILDEVDSKIGKRIEENVKAFKDKTIPLAKAFESLSKTNTIKAIAEAKLTRSIINELIGGSDVTKGILKLMRAKEVYEKFYNDTRHDLNTLLKDKLPSTDEEEVAIQMSIIDTDVQCLNMDASEISELLINKTKLQNEIDSIIKTIDSLAKTKEQKNYANYIINQAHGLGLLLGKGIVGIQNSQMMNAHNIVSGNYYKGKVPISSKGMEEIKKETIDKLATLYAIKYTNDKSKSIASNYINNNIDGINDLIGLMKSHNEKSKKMLFNGEEHLMAKGFSATINNSDIEFDVVDISKMNEMTKKGFKYVKPIIRQNKVIMKRYNPTVKFTEGIMDVKRQEAKGTREDIQNPKNIDMSFLALNRISSLYHIEAGTFTLPLVDRKEIGEISSYRYVANKELRIKDLGEEYRFSKVVPETFAMSYRKLHGIVNNRLLANELIKMMREDMPKNPQNYIAIKNEGETEKLYRLIPEDMRKKINSILKGDTLYVHKDLIDNVFGYKNASLSEAKIIKDIPKLKWMVRVGEKVWEDLVGHIRKGIVIKTKEVVIDNIISNFITLVWRGMNPIKAIKYMDEGRILLNQYRKDLSTIRRLEALRDAGLKYDKVALQSAMNSRASNIIGKLVRAGQFQSVIDDIDTELDDNGNIPELYASMMVSRMPKIVQNIVNNLYINENTRIYKFLMKTVQYSDFVARYAYFKYMTEEKGKKIEEAIDEVEDMFVNYSLLQNRFLQYASDTGMFMFSKYFLRIQKQIARAVKKNPFRGSNIGIAQTITKDVSDISDSFIGTSNVFNRAGVEPSDSIAPHLQDWFI